MYIEKMRHCHYNELGGIQSSIWPLVKKDPPFGKKIQSSIDKTDNSLVRALVRRLTTSECEGQ